jgi:hypothetical protein
MTRRRVMILAAGLAAMTAIAALLRPRMTEAEVLQIAEPVLEAAFPRGFPQGRPYHAKFSPVAGVWHVRGTVPPGAFGGTPEAKVRDSDRHILHVTATQ